MKQKIFRALPLIFTFIYHSTCWAWDLNDVSILMPLPQKSDTPVFLLKTNSSGSQGVLLPRSLYERIGPLSFASYEGEHTYENLRAVSLRLDPCPTEKDPSQTCKPELRIVWQPVVFDRFQKKWTTEDAAVHTFYLLNPTQFLRLKQGLSELKSKMELYGVHTDHKPLGIHPALLTPKTAPIFREALFSLVLQNVGESNFYKVTFMKLMVPTNWWRFFSGFMKDGNGQWVTTTIPRQENTEMDIIEDSQEKNPETGLVDEMRASYFVLDKLPKEDDLRYIATSGYRKTDTSHKPDWRDFDQFKVGIGTIQRLQNPRMSNPHTVDCVHCHVANATETFALKVFPNLKSESQRHADRYKNPNPVQFNLSNTSIATRSTQIVRAFGYFEDLPSIMTRTIHDSAESANWLNRH